MTDLIKELEDAYEEAVNIPGAHHVADTIDSVLSTLRKVVEHVKSFDEWDSKNLHNDQTRHILEIK